MKKRGISENSHGVRLLRSLAEAGKVVFSTKDAKRAARDAKVPSDYVNYLLLLLLRDGWVVRLKRGLYARCNGSPGDVRVHPFLIATQLVQPSAISHWSALQHHGLTEQIPVVVTASTPKRMMTPTMRKVSSRQKQGKHGWEVMGHRYEYIILKKEHFFGIEEVWMDENTKVPVTDAERTVLDTILFPRIFGGMGTAMEIMKQHLSRLDMAKLVDYAIRYDQIAVAKRLGWMLEQSDVASSVLKPLLVMPVTSYHLLDSTRPASGDYDKRWMIRNNLVKEKA